MGTALSRNVKACEGIGAPVLYSNSSTIANHQSIPGRHEEKEEDTIGPAVVQYSKNAAIFASLLSHRRFIREKSDHFVGRPIRMVRTPGRPS